MNFEINIKKIVIIRNGKSVDHVMIETDKPEAVFPFSGTLSLNFTVANGMGEEYVKTNFPNVEYIVKEF
jgi:hypothetical protein